MFTHVRLRLFFDYSIFKIHHFEASHFQVTNPLGFLVPMTMTAAMSMPAVRLPQQLSLHMVRMLRCCNRSLDFRYRYRWQELAEQQKQRHEHTKASEEHQTVKHRWTEIPP